LLFPQYTKKANKVKTWKKNQVGLPTFIVGTLNSATVAKGFLVTVQMGQQSSQNFDQ